MPSVHDILTEQFYAWERRGRGWQVFDQPISLEPPFRPFHGYYQPETPIIDDGRRPTALSSFVQRLSRKLQTEPTPPPVIPTPEEEPEPQSLTRCNLIELQASLPSQLDGNKEAFAQFLQNLALCREPIAFELLGTSGKVNVQFVTSEHDAPLVRRQLQAYFPETLFLPRKSALESTWESCTGNEMLAVEFGLGQEFILPLANTKADPFIGLVSTLSELQPGELALFQVLFQPTHEDWAGSILQSVSDSNGRPIFVNRPELTSAAEEKIRHPLCAVLVRIAVKSQTFDRVVEIAKDLAASLRVFSQPQGNQLVPLNNDDYPFYEHIEDVLHRQSRRSGMLLNSEELFGFVHLPSNAVCSPALERETGKTKAAPKSVIGTHGLVLGVNDHAGQRVTVALSPEQRVRHAHIIGASGTGKSTLLFNLIRQDIENGEGVALLDPHGDLVDRLLGIIPENRIDDVVLIDPSDEEYSVGFNILSAHSDLEKNLLASDLVSVFERLSKSWGDQMGSVLSNAILAFLESEQGGTLADLRRFLLEPQFRERFLATVRDPEVVYYWRKGFTQLSGNKSIGPVLTRLETFLSPKPIRYMVSQKVNRLDFSNILDTGKIFLAKLSQGAIGRENSYLLGTLLVSKFQQLAMSRQKQAEAQRRDYWLYCDEFHNFITPSMAEILTGTRKYRLGLVLAHQELRQLQRDSDVASAVMSNPGTRICFRVGDDDARKLADGFSFFDTSDLQNLEIGHAIARIERSSYDFNLTVPLPDNIDEGMAAERRRQVIATSRARYAKPRADIEALLAQTIQTETTGRASEAPKPLQQAAPTPVAQPVPPPPPTKPTPPQPAAETATPPPDELQNVSVERGDQTLPRTISPIIPETQKPIHKLGRGGPLHQTTQKEFQRIAQELGFIAKIEEETPDGRKRYVDLLLKRGNIVIACEFPCKNSIQYEVGNITKCFESGFSRIAVVCDDKKHLDKIQEAARAKLGKIAERVGYFLPEEFIDQLKGFAAQIPVTASGSEVIGNHAVSSVPSRLSPADIKARNMKLLKVLTAVMRKSE